MNDSEDAPVIKIVNLILAQAIREKASDIHLEPFQKILKRITTSKIPYSMSSCLARTIGHR